MKPNKTLVLIIILLILVTIKIKFPDFPNIKTDKEETEITVIGGHEVISTATSKVVARGPQTYLNENDEYEFSMIQVVLYDDLSKSLVEEYRKAFQERLRYFNQTLLEASKGIIKPETKLVFLNVKELGSKELSYDRTIFEWYKQINEKLKDEHEYNILLFVPIYEMEWCTDGPSQGFNYQGTIFFCMETYFNPKMKTEHKGATALMIHKMMHGLGYNHQDQVYKQYLFLDWAAGLPETNGLLHGKRGFGDLEKLFFDKQTTKVLGLMDKNEFEKTCLDKEGLICDPINNYFCKDSWGPMCADIDKDGIIDSEDNYVFNSPIQGIDSDNDGIIDSLDLCPDSKLKVKDLDAIMKINIRNSPARITFEPSNMIKRITKKPMKMIGGFIRFPEKGETTRGNIVTLTNQAIMWRLEVYYEEEGQEYYRPYYVHYPGFDADFVYEREWYYFQRFGCDIPTTVDFKKLETYDKNADGLPDKELFPWAEKIDENYDWDGDGHPDIHDTLPTVKGNCSNDYVQGVKDSDGDGLCDPGQFDFSKIGLEETHDLMIIIKNPEYDREPYIKN